MGYRGDAHVYLHYSKQNNYGIIFLNIQKTSRQIEVGWHGRLHDFGASLLPSNHRSQLGYNQFGHASRFENVQNNLAHTNAEQQVGPW